MKTNSISAGLASNTRTITTARQLLFRRACLWTGFLAFATIAFGPQPAQAAVTEAWVHRFSNVVSSTTDQAVKVVRDAAGDIIVTGSTAGGFPGADMLTIKYSGADGSVLWQQRYNSPANGDDRPSALAVDGSGNVVVTGFADGYAYTAKYAAADGVLLWEKRYTDGYWKNNERASALAVDGSGNVVVTGMSESDHYYTAKYAAADGALLWEKRYSYGQGAAAVAVDGSGNVVVTGYAQGTNLADYYTAKYAAADGALVWEQRYNGPANWEDRPSAVAVDGSGNVVVTGSSWGTNNNVDYYTAKYAAADGALVWEQRYNGPADGHDQASALAVDSSGNVVVTGSSGFDFYTAKYAAANGALLWEQRYNGPANSADIANAVTVDDSDNVVVTGRTDSVFGLGPIGGDYYTAKYAAADGVLLWERRYDGPANGADIANAVTVDASGNVVVTGQAWNGTNDDYYTAKYAAADGALLWEQRYNGSAPSSASAREVAVDGNGNVAVTGVVYNYHPDGSLSDGDYYTAKYAAADGALLWERRYNGPANDYDQASAVAVDGHGNVVVTGSSGSDSYTAKYAAADGALLWEKRYNSGDAIAVVVDGSGNVVVTGTSYGINSNGDFYTAKYAAADGSLLWEKRYIGPGNHYAKANALAIDASGNVVVTGYSFFWGVQGDYYTAKYAAADGALLWEKRYSYGEATAVAVDGSGNVVVTGRSGNGTNDDYYTAKYAAADGALLWEQRYNGPANGYDQASGVAVDGSGNVVVTGSSESDYYTVKYAAADGALLWEKRYSSGQATALAVDSSGNVVVTGSSGFDFYTAKYAAADGALLWEKRFTGPASVGDSSRCLALGPDGMVAVTGSSNGGYATVVYREAPAVSIRQLIINGSFEIPDATTYILIGAGEDTIAPWVVGLHSVDVGDAAGNGFITGPAFDGEQQLDLNGLGRGRLTQAFATTPGLLYTVTFAYANNYYNSSTAASATVRVFDSLGDRLNRTITHIGSVAGDLKWTVFNEQFTALQNTTSLEFTSLTDTNGYSGGIMLDAVQVFEGASLKILSITGDGNDSVVLKGRGIPNGVHRIQASVDLSAGSFIDIATVTADAAGLFQFQDTRAGLTKRFYRVAFP